MTSRIYVANEITSLVNNNLLPLEKRKKRVKKILNYCYTFFLGTNYVIVCGFLSRLRHFLRIHLHLTSTICFSCSFSHVLTPQFFSMSSSSFSFFFLNLENVIFWCNKYFFRITFYNLNNDRFYIDIYLFF